MTVGLESTTHRPVNGYAVPSGASTVLNFQALFVGLSHATASTAGRRRLPYFAILHVIGVEGLLDPRQESGMS